MSGLKLGRDSGQRTALLRNLSSDLIVRGYVVTTLTKAKFAQGYVEKLITSVKKDRLFHTRRVAAVVTHDALLRLVNEIGPGFTNRQSGFTRITKIGSRKGDNAPTARLEILEWEKVKAPVKSAAKKEVIKKVKPKKAEKTEAKKE